MFEPQRSEGLNIPQKPSSEFPMGREHCERTDRAVLSMCNDYMYLNIFLGPVWTVLNACRAQILRILKYRNLTKHICCYSFLHRPRKFMKAVPLHSWSKSGPVHIRYTLHNPIYGETDVHAGRSHSRSSVESRAERGFRVRLHRIVLDLKISWF